MTYMVRFLNIIKSLYEQNNPLNILNSKGQKLYLFLIASVIAAVLVATFRSS